MDPERRRQNIQRLTKVAQWGGGLVGAVLVAPFVFMAIKGIVGLAVAVAAGGTVVKLTPWAKMKLDNLFIKLLVHEARTNPIETLQNLKIEKVRELQEADQKIILFETAVRNFDSKIKESSRQFPDEVGSYKEISEKMHQGLDSRKKKQGDARLALGALDQSIDKATMHYEMAQAALQVTELSNNDKDRVYAEIKQKVAFDAVQSELNRAFASLNTAVDQDIPELSASAVVKELPAAPEKGRDVIEIRGGDIISTKRQR